MRFFRTGLRVFTAASLLVLACALALGATGELAESFLAAINAERARRGLSPAQLSDSLTKLAQDRAEEIGGSESIAFEPAAGNEALAAASEYGYSAWLAQELAAVDESEPCEIVAKWTERLGGSDAYLRHEVRDVGIGTGLLEGQPIYVLQVGVPSSQDPLRNRLPGVAPREWLTARLFGAFNRARLKAGLSPFERSEPLDTEAQRLAELLLLSEALEGSGVRPLSGGGSILYFKARGRWRAGDPAAAVNHWFKSDRDVAVFAGLASAGTGLYSRGSDESLEAVWTLAVRARP